MAKYVDLNEMLKQAKEETGADSKKATETKKKGKGYKQYDNALAILSRLGRTVTKAGGVVSSSTKKVYNKAKSKVFDSKSYKQSKKLPAGDSVKFAGEQAGKIGDTSTYKKLVNYAKKINFTKIIPTRNPIKSWNNTQYIKLNRTRLPRISAPMGTYEGINERKRLSEKYSCGKVDWMSKKLTIVENSEKAKLDKKAGKEAQKAEKTAKKVGKSKQSNPKLQRAGNIFKEALPFAMAIVPGGLAAGFALSHAQRQADMFNEVNAQIATDEANRAAREHFINLINDIDAGKWMKADDEAYSKAQKAYEQYLVNYPNDLEGAQSKYDSTLNAIMQQRLGLENVEDYDLYHQLHDPIAQDLNSNINEWINKGWESLGYANETDAIEQNMELFEGYLNGDPASVEGWRAILDQVSAYYLDAGVFDVMKEQVPSFAEQNISVTVPYDDVALGDFISNNPELAVLGVVGVLGVTAVSYVASRAVVKKVWKDKDQKPAPVTKEAEGKDLATN